MLTEILTTTPPADGTVIALAITTAGGLLTLIVQLVFAERRRRMEREFDRAERASIHRTTVAKIDENTQISKQAFSEANHINLKIAALAGNPEALAELGRRTLAQQGEQE